MRINVIPRLHVLTIIALIGAITAMPGRADTGKKTLVPAQTAKTADNISAKPANAPQAPGTKYKRVMGPFDRVIAPHMIQLMGPRSSATSGRTVRRSQAAPAGTSAGGAFSFPGFVSTPFLTLNNGDFNSTFDSVSADFNNDGKMDIATIQDDGTVNVILNPGSLSGIASLSPLPPNSSATSTFPSIAWVIAADMNGDGFPDLVAEDANNNAIIVWIGKGDGTFGTATSYTVAPTSGASWFLGGGIVVADFNGDGVPDVATVELAPNAGFSSTQTVVTEQTFINKGDGTLTPATESDTTFNDFYLADYGELDVVSNDGNTASGIAFLLFDAGNVNGANMGNDILVINSQGNGTFAPAVEPTAPLVNNSEVYVSGGVIATNLTAKFTTASSAAKKKSQSKVQPQGTLGTGIATTDIVFITGDGAVYDSPYTPGGNPTVANLLVGQNTEVAPTIPANPGSSPSLVSSYIPYEEVLNVADMNGDGLQDLVVYGNAAVYVFPNSGNGAFTTAPTQVAGATGGDQQPQPADFDGSGFNSFVNVDFILNQIGYYQNLGGISASQAGQFFATPLVNANYGNYGLFGGNVNVQAAADLNGDGLQDIVAYDWSKQAIVNGVYYPDISIGINNGAATGANQVNGFTFTTAVTAASLSTLGGGLAFVEPVTITNSAGNSILIVTNQGLYISTSKAGGAFSTPAALNLGITTGCPLSYADVADINGDGNPDIVIAYGGDASCGGGGSTASGYFTLLGNADGTFQTATFTPFGGSLFQVRLISFNAAGALDLAAVDLPINNAGLGVYIIPGKGDGTFNLANATEPVSNYVVSDIVPGDFNSDGKQDLTLTTEGQWNSSTNSIVPNTSGVLLVPATGDYAFGNATTANPGNYPLWGSYADFNGDGAPDLALAELYNIADSSYYYEPLVQILPNMGGGAFGPAIIEMDSSFDFGIEGTTYSGYTFTGNFGNSGGADLVVTGSFNTSVFINQGVTAISLTASSSAPSQGSPVTLTAVLSQAVSASAPLTGSVSFSSGGVVLGSAEIVNGTATLTTTSLPVGTDTVTATYSGDPSHNQATASTTLTVGAVNPAFTLSASTGSLTLSQGATGSVTLNLAANGTFNGSISFSCSGAPSEASCTVAPASLALTSNQTGNVAVVIATTPKNNQYQASNRTSWTKTLGGISFAGLLLFVIPRRRRLIGVPALLVLAMLSFGSMAMLSGCSGSGNKYPGTPTGTSTITVTATSGSISQTQTISVTITSN